MTKDQKRLRKRIRENEGLAEVATLMTAENLGASNRRGETAYHLAAQSGAIGCFPAVHLTSRNLTTMDKNQFTPLHRAAYNGHIPKILALVPEVLNDENLRYRCKGGTVYHVAAHAGRLRDLPNQLLNASNLLLIDWGCDNTVLHYIVVPEDFEALSDDVFEHEKFLTSNHEGQTVFHRAACVGAINERIGKLLTAEAIVAKDVNGATPLLDATRTGCVIHFPVSLVADMYDEFRRVYVLHRKDIRESQGEAALATWSAGISSWYAKLTQMILARRSGLEAFLAKAAQP